MVINRNEAVQSAYNSKSGVIKANELEGKSNAFKRNLEEAQKVVDQFVDVFNESSANGLIEGFKTSLSNVMEMSDEDKRAIARMAYGSMQRSIKDAIKREKNAQEEFKRLKEEKDYYLEIKKSGGLVREAKYDFGGKAGYSRVTKKELDEALKKVQGRIDDICNATEAKYDVRDRRSLEYAYAGALFFAATEIYTDAMKVGVRDTSISGKWTRTEEDFLSQSESTVSALEERSDSLKGTMEQYLAGENDPEMVKAKKDNPLSKDTMKAIIANMFEEWRMKLITLENGLGINSDEE